MYLIILFQIVQNYMLLVEYLIFIGKQYNRATKNVEVSFIMDQRGKNRAGG